MISNDATTAADLKKMIGQELMRVPDCVRSGGWMMAKEYKLRVERAIKLCNTPRPKIAELKEALYLLQIIDKYQAPSVSMAANGRMR